MASEESARVDFARLRSDRRRRLFDAMARHHVDVLMLGRPANVRYASGARQLWTAGSRPFGPGCVVVGETGQVHLLSVWDEGIPPEVPRNNLYGLSWNPMNLLASLRAVPGLWSARSIGTDGLTPGFAERLSEVARDAALVDGGRVVAEARRTKTTDEVACIATATAMAESGLAAMVGALVPGVTERHLLAVFAAHLAGLGSPTPATEGVVCATSGDGWPRFRQLATARPIGPGDLVSFNPGALYAGYEGGVGRTFVAGTTAPTTGQRGLAERGRTALNALLSACRSGRSGADLRQAWAGTGEAFPPLPLAYGLGLGIEAPLIADSVGDDERLQAGDVVALQAWVGEEGVGGFLEREVVIVGDADPEVLSRFSHGPAAQ